MLLLCYWTYILTYHVTANYRRKCSAEIKIYSALCNQLLTQLPTHRLRPASFCRPDHHYMLCIYVELMMQKGDAYKCHNSERYFRPTWWYAPRQCCTRVLPSLCQHSQTARQQVVANWRTIACWPGRLDCIKYRAVIMVQQQQQPQPENNRYIIRKRARVTRDRTCTLSNNVRGSLVLLRKSGGFTGRNTCDVCNAHTFGVWSSWRLRATPSRIYTRATLPSARSSLAGHPSSLILNA